MALYLVNRKDNLALPYVTLPYLMLPYLTLPCPAYAYYRYYEAVIITVMI